MDAKQRNDLHAYIGAVRNVPFELGVHDCFIFTNRAWSILYGAGYADHWVGSYAGLGPKAFKASMERAFGSADLHTALDEGLSRFEGPYPPKGSLVTSDRAARYYTKQALGICVGPTAAFVGPEHLLYLPIGEVTGAWVPCHS